MDSRDSAAPVTSADDDWEKFEGELGEWEPVKPGKAPKTRRNALAKVFRCDLCLHNFETHQRDVCPHCHDEYRALQVFQAKLVLKHPKLGKLSLSQLMKWLYKRAIEK